MDDDAPKPPGFLEKVPPGDAKASDYTGEEIAEALAFYGGNFAKAAEALHVSPTDLGRRVAAHRKLRALCMDLSKLEESQKALVPDSAFRDLEMPSDKGEKEEVGALLVNNIGVITGGLSKAGISDDTIAKLETLGGFEKHAGQFLLGSLDMMHRVITYTSVALLERAEQIKEKLKDKTLPPKTQVAYERLYAQINEQMFKAYDRTLHGTELMVKAMGKGDEEDEAGKRNAKPGFAPLSEMKKTGKG